jgi:hypothetical protein
MKGGLTDIQAEAEALKPIMRLEDTTVWEMDKAKETKKGVKTYKNYWMASWREGYKVKNDHLVSCHVPIIPRNSPRLG